MQKKIIALAIAAMVSAPAFADNANIDVYGKAFMTFDAAQTDAAGGINSKRVNTNASRLGVKGSEDLGDGLKALFQYEVEMDADGNTGAGLGKTRNSGAGIEAGFGKVIFGIWDSPFKAAHNKIELFDNTTSWSATKTIGISAGKDYNTRQKNMIQYWSPKLGGVQAAVMYSPDEAPTATVNKSILSMSGTYDENGLYVSVGYESRADQTTVATTDSALRAVGKYSLGDFWLGAMVESMKTNTSLTTSVSGSNMELVGGVKMGAGSLAASYAMAGSTAVAPVAANDVSQLSLKYGYNFSKRTELFAAYASHKVAGATAVTTSFIGGGMIHSF